LKSNSHVRRVFSLLIIAVIIAFAVRQLVIPDSWGDIGYYRAEGLKDILSQQQAYQSQKTLLHAMMFTISMKRTFIVPLRKR
jgi:hypothetical protein